MTAEKVMLVAGWLAFFITIFWVRKRELREKYAMVWLFMAAYFLALGSFPWLLINFADWARMSYPTAALLFMVPPLYGFTFANSVTVSRQYRRGQRLMQEYAILSQRMRELEDRLEAAGIPPRQSEAKPAGKPADEAAASAHVES